MFCLKQILFTLLITTDYFSSVEENDVKFFSELNQKDYADYMQKVIKELEADKEFQNKILDKKSSASSEDFLMGFEFASSSVRSKLDEIKRREIDRLNMAKLQLKRLLKKNLKLDKNKRDIMVHSLTSDDDNHLYSTDNTKFTKEDLEQLISQIKHDLKLVDIAREKQYRRYEWKKDRKNAKELEINQDSIDKIKRLEELKKGRKSYSNHKKINEPGGEEQMKELWRTIDNLDPSYFNIKTFFNLHDLNQDGHWDIEEIEAMFIPDIQKVYREENKTEDIEEKYHEIMKMRQHFMEKMDTDKDEIITYEEYFEYSKTKDFKDNKEWKVTEEQDKLLYSEEDIENFEKEFRRIKNKNL